VATTTVTVDVGNMTTPTSSTVEFTSVSVHGMTGSIEGWNNSSNCLSNTGTYAYVPFTAGDVGISDSLDLKRDFLTAYSVPAAATITHIRIAVWAYFGGMSYAKYYCTINNTETSQKSLTTGGTSDNMYPSSGTLADWGITNAQAKSFLGGTYPFRFWAEDTSGSIAVAARLYKATVSFRYTYPDTLVAGEGAFPVGMFSH